MKEVRKLWWGVMLALIGAACGSDEDGAQTQAALVASPTILIDLDPNSTGLTCTVENLTASPQGLLFTSDRETGDILRIDPKSPSKVVVGSYVSRPDPMNPAMALKANGAGLAVMPNGDLLIASGAFAEIARLPAAAAMSATPSPAAVQTLITGVMGANSILIDGNNLYITGGATGAIYRASLSGGSATVWTQLSPNTRLVPPDNAMQSVVANGIARDPTGAAFMVADTSRGAIWRIPVNPDGSPGAPVMVVQSPMLEGADGINFDSQGRLWVAVNERNALVVVQNGQAHEVFKNANIGPLEFPSALVFIGNKGYVSNYDRPRRDNLAADGMTSMAGVGSSIASFDFK